MYDSFDIIIGGSIAQAIVPKDLGANAITGVWGNLRKAGGEAAVVLVLAGGLAGNGPIIKLEQATDNAGTGAKALLISDLRVLAATNLSAPAADEVWQEIAANRTTPIAEYDTDAAGGDTKQLMVVATIREGDLDPGFTHFRINSLAAGGNRIGTVLYIAKDKANKGQADHALLGN